MTSSAITMLLIATGTVWGGLLLAIANLVRNSPDQSKDAED